MTKKPEPRRIVWFSCGANSASLAKVAVDKWGDSVQVVYCNTMSTEHPDNKRFFKDVEAWIGKPIEIIRSKTHTSIDHVFQKERYMAGPRGAKCTVVMKKIPRFEFQLPDDVHMFGFSAERREVRRAKDFTKRNPELILEWPLIDLGLTKQDCFNMIADAGIELPAMYKLGYKNNNCLGCVKSTSPWYWNKIRRDFPNVFVRRCKQSRAIGVKLVQLRGKRIFLDELDPMESYNPKEDLSCGPQC